MPKSTHFSYSEILRIWKLKAKGKSVSDISIAINRSKRGIYRVLARGDQYQPKSRSGRPRKTSKREDRRIRNLASNGHCSANQIKNTITAKVSRETIRRRIVECGYLKKSKLKRKPRLQSHHKKARLNWAQEHMSYSDEWLQVVFSDEKKWNLDGPDGFSYYWHDLRKGPLTQFSRRQGGGSVMVWGGFAFNGQTSLAFLKGKQDSKAYQATLESNLLPFGEPLSGPNWKFQQDNASIHTSRSTKEWFIGKNITVLDWPAYSPDCNPIENVWGILTRVVYANGKQYSTVSELKEAIEMAWYVIKPETLQKLVLSMKKRVFDLIKNHGSFIDY